MAKYRATIFNFGHPLNGVYYNTHSVQGAIEKFNNTGNIVTLEDDVPGHPGHLVNLERAAATAKLSIEEHGVIAEMTLLDTHCGELVEDMIEHNLLVVVPITIGTAIGNVVQVDAITKLAFLNREHVRKQTELSRMKDWVNQDLRIYNLFNIEMYDITKINDK